MDQFQGSQSPGEDGSNFRMAPSGLGDGVDGEAAGGFGELRQTRMAIWGVVGILIILAVASLINGGWSGVSATSIIIDVLLIRGLLLGQNWARVWTLVRVVLGILLFGGLAIYQGNLPAALLQVGLLGPITILLTGVSTRNRLAIGFGVFAAGFAGLLTLSLLTVDVFALDEGECFNLPAGVEGQLTGNLPRSDCEEAHDVEVFAVTEYPAVSGGYPGESEASETALDLCMSRFEDYVGARYEETVLDIYVLYPTWLSWTVDSDRSVVCGVFDPGGEKLVGSVEGRGGEQWAAAAFDFGVSTGLDVLQDGCASGSMADCDMLLFAAAVDSDYERTALTCGGRNEPLDLTVNICQTHHNDISGLWSTLIQCEEGLFPACDMLAILFPDDLSVTAFTSSCGKRREQPSPEPCTAEFGVGSRSLTVEKSESEPFNLALRRPATASSFDGTQPAGRAVDGNPQTAWNAGGYAPNWVEIDLGTLSMVHSIRLMTSQLPAGPTVHYVLGEGPGGVLLPLVILDRTTEDGQWLFHTPDTPWRNVRAIRVLTVDSPSWVAWREIEIIGTSG